MKPSTKDQVTGALHEAKGKVKEETGKLGGNPEMEVEGRDEKNAGKVQKVIGKVEKAVGS